MTKKKLDGSSTSPIAVMDSITMPPIVVHVNLIQPPDSYRPIVACRRQHMGVRRIPADAVYSSGVPG